jgi:hypothetical protein
MKKILIIALCLLAAGCSTLTAISGLATSSVTPTEALIAANAYDAIEAGGTAFLTYCHTNKDVPATCIAANRRSVIQYIRAGRAARNQVETYVQTSTSIPAAVYNAMVTATTNLKSTPATNYVGQ